MYAATDIGGLPEDMMALDSGNLPIDSQIQCGSPPPPPTTEACIQWVCEEAASPACWECTTIDSDEGESCTAGDGSLRICRNGRCTDTQDPSETGPHEVEKVDVSIDLGAWLPATSR